MKMSSERQKSQGGALMSCCRMGSKPSSSGTGKPGTRKTIVEASGKSLAGVI